MTVSEIVKNAAGDFDTPAQAIITRCKQTGVQLRVDGERLTAKGNSEVIAEWGPIISRHKPAIIAELTGQEFDADVHCNNKTMAADHADLIASVIELCQIAGYSKEDQERMLEASRKLAPYLVTTECVYFRWQAIRAKAKNWNLQTDNERSAT